MSEFQMHISNS